MPEMLHHAHLETPLGWLQISGTENGITAITFSDENPTVFSSEIPECVQNAYGNL
jgi:hypothetical protein